MSDVDKPFEPALREVPGVDLDLNRAVRVPARRQMPAVSELVDGVRRGNRAMMGRAFTLVESLNPDHRRMAEEMLEALLPFTGDATRVGVSGVPGAGKSTFLEAMGTWLVEEKGHRVAVLAIDPSSEVSGGSILGDKTRMERLSTSPNAIVRPSPSGSIPGGVARATRESIIVAEAAGFDVVMVETVGVGQSETDVAWMTDFFLLLTVTGTGDELQGIKRGVLELADSVAINKADGDNIQRAQIAKVQLEAALHLLHSNTEHGETPVLTCSSLTGHGVADLWNKVDQRVRGLRASGALDCKRRRQTVRWMSHSIRGILGDLFHADTGVTEQYEEFCRRVEAGEILPFRAAQDLVRLFLQGNSDGTMNDDG